MSKLEDVFREVFDLADDEDVAPLEYRGIEQWDSVAHMQLVAAIEDEFDLMLETDDVVAMSSFKEAQRILQSLGVEEL